ncbi:MAG: hypothetical protein A2V66_11050 [Ignavibacteria bacterium RBG_13_36_8]|nr:MAG: hypothetical protein A2V66_11050 [Ignavibacteria bacterium RBG_13_36_8]
MTNKRVITKGSLAMENVAEHYANELDAKYRTLNHFITHAGEIGRAHETFLRGILIKFLPQNIKVSTGFIASPNWTSRQQDILLYTSKYSTLFEVGDCTVIDHQSLVGAIEVKTRIGSIKKFIETIEIQSLLRENIRQPAFFAIYSWDTISLNHLQDALWEYVRRKPLKNTSLLPDVVYARGKYFLKINRDRDQLSPPYNVWHINENGINDGQALLGLIASVWEFGLNTVLPWWLLSWHYSLGRVAGKSEEIPWPKNLMNSFSKKLKT